MLDYKVQYEEKREVSAVSTYIMELLAISLLLLSYIINFPLLTLLAFILACGLVIFSNEQKAIYRLAFFTSFAGLFVYNGRHMFFVMAALFIIKMFMVSKVNQKTFLLYFIIFAYSLMFSDFQGEYSFAKLIGLILLFVIPLIASSSDKIDCSVFMQHYILGFVISTVVGFFAKSIPSLYQLFEVDLMWTDNYQELTRFFGLAFDSNFYALSNFTIVAYLLFAFDKITPFRGILALFMLISGVMTISKSYFLIIGVLLIFYIVKNIYKVKRLVLFAFVAIVGVWLFSVVSNNLGYNAIELIFSRFIKGGSFSENTTGRTEIWKYYIELFGQNGIKELLFGFGFNASVVHAAHNTIMEFAYHYGFAGVLLWGIYFAHCLELFRIKTKTFKNKSPMISMCFGVGVFFLSAYTYEAFWIGLVICFMTFGSRKRIGENNV